MTLWTSQSLWFNYRSTQEQERKASQFVSSFDRRLGLKIKMLISAFFFLACLPLCPGTHSPETLPGAGSSPPSRQLHVMAKCHGLIRPIPLRDFPFSIASGLLGQQGIWHSDNWLRLWQAPFPFFPCSSTKRRTRLPICRKKDGEGQN